VRLQAPAHASYDGRLRRPSQAVVAVVEPEIRSTGLELRAPGLWADHVCEEQDERWSVELEAFGLLVDEGDDIGPDTRGERVPVGLDLEWERSGPVEQRPAGSEMPCAVHGEVLIGPDTVAVEGAGAVSHAWDAGERPH